MASNCVAFNRIYKRESMIREETWEKGLQKFHQAIVISYSAQCGRKLLKDRAGDVFEREDVRLCSNNIAALIAMFPCV